MSDLDRINAASARVRIRALTDAETAAVDALDRAYPDGWRCGDPFLDLCTVRLAVGLRQVLGAVFGVPPR